MTTKSSTSPRALRAARRGEALLQHEREQEELGGREEIAAHEESAADAAEAGVAGMGSGGAAEAAESEVAPLAETEAVAAAGVTVTGQSRVGEESQTVLGDSPSPLGAAEIAVVVAEAVRRPEGPPNEETAPTAAASAGTSVAAAAANKQGHARAASGRLGPGTGAAACTARGKTGTEAAWSRAGTWRPGTPPGLAAARAAATRARASAAIFLSPGDQR
ncbi:unnamed protein product [Closterium sp. Naga37s-1]|nr:unnamed protein product [Closterium sp. Naga37s-1]